MTRVEVHRQTLVIHIANAVADLLEHGVLTVTCVDGTEHVFLQGEWTRVTVYDDLNYPEYSFTNEVYQ